MDRKICVLTGPTSGIGEATAFGLAKAGYFLILIGRNVQKLEILRTKLDQVGESGNDIFQADLLSMASIKSCTSEILKKYDSIDILINNAGGIFPERALSEDGIETTLMLNHFAPFLLTGLLLPALQKSKAARIINVNSTAHKMGHINFDDIMLEKGYTSLKAYSQAKLASMMFTFELAKRLQNSSITVNCLHPGVVRTGFGKEYKGFFKFVLKIMQPLMISAEKGAQTSLFLALSDEVKNTSGKYFDKSKIAKTSDEAQKKELWQKLFERTEELSGYKFPDLKQIQP